MMTKTSLRVRAAVSIGSFLFAGISGLAAESAKTQAAPPGSLIMRGASRNEKPIVAAAAQIPLGTGTPEHLFGLSVEQSLKTNGVAILVRAWDPDAFYKRFVPDLPTGEDTKDRLYAAARSNDGLRKALLKEVFSGMDPDIRFLGVRILFSQTALLFRDTATPPVITRGPVENVGGAGYLAFVTERQADGSVHIIDGAHLPGGELFSQTMRRRTLMELREKKLLSDRMSALDQATLSAREPLRLFQMRCDYGKYDLIKEAYEKLPPELQNERPILLRFATSGEQSLKDILVPIERWRRVYPTDPTPDLLLVDFYWQLYHGPRVVREGPDRGIYAFEALDSQQEEAAAAAVQKANAWFLDPALEIKLASYYGGKHPDKARPLLQQALERFPLERIGYSELIKVDLASTNFVGVADSLHKQEVAFQTNLTSMVASRPEYETFRKSFPWKQWQHDYHGVEVKNLVPPR